MRVGLVFGVGLVCLFASSVAASMDAALGYYLPLNPSNPYFMLVSDHEQTFHPGDTFRMHVWGAGGRTIYAAKVTVFYNDIPMYTGKTDVNGLFTYTLPLEGKYLYTIHDSRYVPIGGEFYVVNATAMPVRLFID